MLRVYLQEMLAFNFPLPVNLLSSAGPPCRKGCCCGGLQRQKPPRKQCRDGTIRLESCLALLTYCTPKQTLARCYKSNYEYSSISITRAAVIGEHTSVRLSHKTGSISALLLSCFNTEFSTTVSYILCVSSIRMYQPYLDHMAQPFLCVSSVLLYVCTNRI